MKETVLIALTGFGIAFFHAAIPTHWLPFVITARAQRWNRHKTILITALAGTGHVLFTAILGVFIAWFGIALHERIGRWFPWIAGGALLIFGLYYIYLQLSGAAHGHSHMFGGHSHHGTTPHLHIHQLDDVVGPHGGKLIDTGEGLMELLLSEESDQANFRLYLVRSDKTPAAILQGLNVALETVRPTQERQHFSFCSEGECLVSIDPVASPFQFVATLNMIHGDHVHTYEVQFPQSDKGDSRQGIVDIVSSRKRISDRVAIASLLTLLTFSPCESFLPVYVSGVRYGWMGFLLLTAVLSIATVAGMIIFTWLALTKLQQLNLRFLEKYESGIIGALLCTLGILIIVFDR